MNKKQGKKPNVKIKYAGMAELADALDLGSSVPDVQVRPLLPAPKNRASHRQALFFNMYSGVEPEKVRAPEKQSGGLFLARSTKAPA